jgi:hypothetical protein
MGSEARTLTVRNADELAEWCGGRRVVQENALDSSVTTPGLNVPTNNGVQRAQVGDTIIHNHDGSFDIQKREETHNV